MNARLIVIPMGGEPIGIRAPRAFPTVKSEEIIEILREQLESEIFGRSFGVFRAASDGRGHWFLALDKAQRYD
jgi:hypothetical protein